MKQLCLFIAINCLALTSPVLASSLADDCNVPAVQVVVDCLQQKLDSRMAQTDELFVQTLEFVSSQSREAPEAKIDTASVIMELRAAKQQWQEFADHECAAARELVGIGTDKNIVELTCLIQLYDQRIRQLKSWRGL